MNDKFVRIQQAIGFIIFITIFGGVTIAGHVSNNKTTVSDNTLNHDEFKIEGHFIVGEVLVPLGDGTESPFTLHVQRHKRSHDKWTNEMLIIKDDAILSRFLQI